MARRKGTLKKSVVVTRDYAIEAIRNYKIEGRSEFYQVKWKGFPESENTWEPAKNLIDAKQLVKKFHEEEKRKEKAMEGQPRRGPKRKAKVDKKKRIEKAPSVITILSSSVGSDNNKAEQFNESSSSEDDEPNGVTSKPEPVIQRETISNFVNKSEQNEEDGNNAESFVQPEVNDPDEQDTEKLPMPAEPSAELQNSPSESEEEPRFEDPRWPSKAVQAPETGILRVLAISLKDSEIFYQVLYAERVDCAPKITEMHSGLVLAQNPGALADYFNKEVTSMMVPAKRVV